MEPNGRPGTSSRPGTRGELKSRAETREKKKQQTNKKKTVADTKDSEWLPVPPVTINVDDPYKAIYSPEENFRAFKLFTILDSKNTGAVTVKEINRVLMGELQKTFTAEFDHADVGILWELSVDNCVVIQSVEQHSPASEIDHLIKGLMLVSINGTEIPKNDSRGLQIVYKELIQIYEENVVFEFNEPAIIVSNLSCMIDVAVDGHEFSIQLPIGAYNNLQVLEDAVLEAFTAVHRSFSWIDMHINPNNRQITFACEKYPFQLLFKTGTNFQRSCRYAFGFAAEDTEVGYCHKGEPLILNINLGISLGELETLTTELFEKFDTDGSGLFEFEEFRDFFIKFLDGEDSLELFKAVAQHRFRDIAKEARWNAIQDELKLRAERRKALRARNAPIIAAQRKKYLENSVQDEDGTRRRVYTKRRNLVTRTRMKKGGVDVASAPLAALPEVEDEEQGDDDQENLDGLSSQATAFYLENQKKNILHLEDGFSSQATAFLENQKKNILHLEDAECQLSDEEGALRADALILQDEIAKSKSNRSTSRSKKSSSSVKSVDIVKTQDEDVELPPLSPMSSGSKRGSRPDSGAAGIAGRPKDMTKLERRQYDKTITKIKEMERRQKLRDLIEGELAKGVEDKKSDRALEEREMRIHLSDVYEKVRKNMVESIRTGKSEHAVDNAIQNICVQQTLLKSPAVQIQQGILSPKFSLEDLDVEVWHATLMHPTCARYFLMKLDVKKDYNSSLQHPVFFTADYEREKSRHSSLSLKICRILMDDRQPGVDYRALHNIPRVTAVPVEDIMTRHKEVVKYERGVLDHEGGFRGVPVKGVEELIGIRPNRAPIPPVGEDGEEAQNAVTFEDQPHKKKKRLAASPIVARVLIHSIFVENVPSVHMFKRNSLFVRISCGDEWKSCTEINANCGNHSSWDALDRLHVPLDAMAKTHNPWMGHVKWNSTMTLSVYSGTAADHRFIGSVAFSANELLDLPREQKFRWNVSTQRPIMNHSKDILSRGTMTISCKLEPGEPWDWKIAEMQVERKRAREQKLKIKAMRQRVQQIKYNNTLPALSIPFSVTIESIRLLNIDLDQAELVGMHPLRMISQSSLENQCFVKLDCESTTFVFFTKNADMDAGVGCSWDDCNTDGSCVMDVKNPNSNLSLKLMLDLSNDKREQMAQRDGHVPGEMIGELKDVIPVDEWILIPREYDGTTVVTGVLCMHLTLDKADKAAAAENSMEDGNKSSEKGHHNESFITIGTIKLTCRLESILPTRNGDRKGSNGSIASMGSRNTTHSDKDNAKGNNSPAGGAKLKFRVKRRLPKVKESIDLPLSLQLISISAVDLKQVHMLSRNQPCVQVRSGAWSDTTSIVKGGGKNDMANDSKSGVWEDLHWDFTMKTEDDGMFVFVNSGLVSIGEAYISTADFCNAAFDDKGVCQIVRYLVPKLAGYDRQSMKNAPKGNKALATGTVRLLFRMLPASAIYSNSSEPVHGVGVAEDPRYHNSTIEDIEDEYIPMKYITDSHLNSNTDDDAHSIISTYLTTKEKSRERHRSYKELVSDHKSTGAFEIWNMKAGLGVAPPTSIPFELTILTMKITDLNVRKSSLPFGLSEDDLKCQLLAATTDRQLKNVLDSSKDNSGHSIDVVDPSASAGLVYEGDADIPTLYELNLTGVESKRRTSASSYASSGEDGCYEFTDLMWVIQVLSESQIGRICIGHRTKDHVVCEAELNPWFSFLGIPRDELGIAEFRTDLVARTPSGKEGEVSMACTLLGTLTIQYMVRPMECSQLDGGGNSGDATPMDTNTMAPGHPVAPAVPHLNLSFFDDSERSVSTMGSLGSLGSVSMDAEEQERQKEAKKLRRKEKESRKTEKLKNQQPPDLSVVESQALALPFLTVIYTVVISNVRSVHPFSPNSPFIQAYIDKRWQKTSETIENAGHLARFEYLDWSVAICKPSDSITLKVLSGSIIIGSVVLSSELLMGLRRGRYGLSELEVPILENSRSNGPPTSAGSMKIILRNETITATSYLGQHIMNDEWLQSELKQYSSIVDSALLSIDNRSQRSLSIDSQEQVIKPKKNRKKKEEAAEPSAKSLIIVEQENLVAVEDNADANKNVVPKEMVESIADTVDNHETLHPGGDEHWNSSVSNGSTDSVDLLTCDSEQEDLWREQAKKDEDLKNHRLQQGTYFEDPLPVLARPTHFVVLGVELVDVPLAALSTVINPMAWSPLNSMNALPYVRFQCGDVWVEETNKQDKVPAGSTPTQWKTLRWAPVPLVRIAGHHQGEKYHEIVVTVMQGHRSFIATSGRVSTNAFLDPVPDEYGTSLLKLPIHEPPSTTQGKQQEKGYVLIRFSYIREDRSPEIEVDKSEPNSEVNSENSAGTPTGKSMKVTSSENQSVALGVNNMSGASEMQEVPSQCPVRISLYSVQAACERLCIGLYENEDPSFPCPIQSLDIGVNKKEESMLTFFPTQMMIKKGTLSESTSGYNDDNANVGKGKSRKLRQSMKSPKSGRSGKRKGGVSATKRTVRTVVSDRDSAADSICKSESGEVLIKAASDTMCVCDMGFKNVNWSDGLMKSDDVIRIQVHTEDHASAGSVVNGTDGNECQTEELIVSSGLLELKAVDILAIPVDSRGLTEINVLVTIPGPKSKSKDKSNILACSSADVLLNASSNSIERKCSSDLLPGNGSVSSDFDKKFNLSSAEDPHAVSTLEGDTGEIVQQLSVEEEKILPDDRVLFTIWCKVEPYRQLNEFDKKPVLLLPDHGGKKEDIVKVNRKSSEKDLDEKDPSSVLLSLMGVAENKLGATVVPPIELDLPTTRIDLEDSESIGPMVEYEEPVEYGWVTITELKLTKLLQLDSFFENSPYILLTCGSWNGITEIVPNGGEGGEWKKLQLRFNVEDTTPLVMTVMTAGLVAGYLTISGREIRRMLEDEAAEAANHSSVPSAEALSALPSMAFSSLGGIEGEKSEEPDDGTVAKMTFPLMKPSRGTENNTYVTVEDTILPGFCSVSFRDTREVDAPLPELQVEPEEVIVVVNNDLSEPSAEETVEEDEIAPLVPASVQANANLFPGLSMKGATTGQSPGFDLTNVEEYVDNEEYDIDKADYEAGWEREIYEADMMKVRNTAAMKFKSPSKRGIGGNSGYWKATNRTVTKDGRRPGAAVYSPSARISRKAMQGELKRLHSCSRTEMASLIKSFSSAHLLSHSSSGVTEGIAEIVLQQPAKEPDAVEPAPASAPTGLSDDSVVSLDMITVNTTSTATTAKSKKGYVKKELYPIKRIKVEKPVKPKEFRPTARRVGDDTNAREDAWAAIREQQAEELRLEEEEKERLEAEAEEGTLASSPQSSRVTEGWEKDVYDYDEGEVASVLGAEFDVNVDSGSPVHAVHDVNTLFLDPVSEGSQVDILQISDASTRGATDLHDPPPVPPPLQIEDDEDNALDYDHIHVLPILWSTFHGGDEVVDKSHMISSFARIYVNDSMRYVCESFAKHIVHEFLAEEGVDVVESDAVENETGIHRKGTYMHSFSNLQSTEQEVIRNVAVAQVESIIQCSLISILSSHETDEYHAWVQLDDVVEEDENDDTADLLAVDSPGSPLVILDGGAVAVAAPPVVAVEAPLSPAVKQRYKKRAGVTMLGVDMFHQESSINDSVPTAYTTEQNKRKERKISYKSTISIQSVTGFSLTSFNMNMLPSRPYLLVRKPHYRWSGSTEPAWKRNITPHTIKGYSPSDLVLDFHHLHEDGHGRGTVVGREGYFGRAFDPVEMRPSDCFEFEIRDSGCGLSIGKFRLTYNEMLYAKKKESFFVTCLAHMKVSSDFGGGLVSGIVRLHVNDVIIPFERAIKSEDYWVTHRPNHWTCYPVTPISVGVVRQKYGPVTREYDKQMCIHPSLFGFIIRWRSGPTDESKFIHPLFQQYSMARKPLTKKQKVELENLHQKSLRPNPFKWIPSATHKCIICGGAVAGCPRCFMLPRRRNGDKTRPVDFEYNPERDARLAKEKEEQELAAAKALREKERLMKLLLRTGKIDAMVAEMDDDESQVSEDRSKTEDEIFSIHTKLTTYLAIKVHRAEVVNSLTVFCKVMPGGEVLKLNVESGYSLYQLGHAIECHHPGGNNPSKMLLLPTSKGMYQLDGKITAGDDKNLADMGGRCLISRFGFTDKNGLYSVFYFPRYLADTTRFTVSMYFKKNSTFSLDPVTLLTYSSDQKAMTKGVTEDPVQVALLTLVASQYHSDSLMKKDFYKQLGITHANSEEVKKENRIKAKKAEQQFRQREIQAEKRRIESQLKGLDGEERELAMKSIAERSEGKKGYVSEEDTRRAEELYQQRNQRFNSKSGSKSFTLTEGQGTGTLSLDQVLEGTALDEMADSALVSEGSKVLQTKVPFSRPGTAGGSTSDSDGVTQYPTASHTGTGSRMTSARSEQQGSAATPVSSQQQSSGFESASESSYNTPASSSFSIQNSKNLGYSQYTPSMDSDGGSSDVWSTPGSKSVSTGKMKSVLGFQPSHSTTSTAGGSLSSVGKYAHSSISEGGSSFQPESSMSSSNSISESDGRSGVSYDGTSRSQYTSGYDSGSVGQQSDYITDISGSTRTSGFSKVNNSYISSTDASDESIFSTVSDKRHDYTSISSMPSGQSSVVSGERDYSVESHDVKHDFRPPIARKAAQNSPSSSVSYSPPRNNAAFSPSDDGGSSIEPMSSVVPMSASDSSVGANSVERMLEDSVADSVSVDTAWGRPEPQPGLSQPGLSQPGLPHHLMPRTVPKMMGESLASPSSTVSAATGVTPSTAPESSDGADADSIVSGVSQLTPFPEGTGGASDHKRSHAMMASDVSVPSTSSALSIGPLSSVSDKYAPPRIRDVVPSGGGSVASDVSSRSLESLLESTSLDLRQRFSTTVTTSTKNGATKMKVRMDEFKPLKEKVDESISASTDSAASTAGAAKPKVNKRKLRAEGQSTGDSSLSTLSYASRLMKARADYANELFAEQQRKQHSGFGGGGGLGSYPLSNPSLRPDGGGVGIASDGSVSGPLEDHDGSCASAPASSLSVGSAEESIPSLSTLEPNTVKVKSRHNSRT